MSTGWNKAKVETFRKAFYEFCGYLKIDSKETGGESPLILYESQKRFFEGIFTSLEQDKHYVVCLKSRQLGITTASYALDLFWVGMHKGLKGAIVFDTDANKEEARATITRYIESLPKSIGFPKVTRNHRHGLNVSNGSSLAYMVAGVKKSAGSGGLGRSRGLNFVHASEISSWGDIEGLRSLQNALAETFPDRLFIWESTARGFDMFHDMWEDAKADTLTKSAVFIGWWAKDTQRFARNSAHFEMYGRTEPNADEQDKIDLVEKLYGYKVTQEQLAWYRHKADPRLDTDGRRPADSVDDDLLMQEQPWTAEESFLLSGSQFFPSEQLTASANQVKQHPFQGFRYKLTTNFLQTEVLKAYTHASSTLKVWEMPDPDGVYAIGADPAYGSGVKADRFVAQVLRCYADGVDQVAEFCTPLLTTYQFAWIIAHLAGCYGNARFILELNGPGNAVFNEFRVLGELIRTGYLAADADKLGVRNVFDNVRQYMYKKSDALTRTPSVFHWESTGKRKIEILERLRDAYHVGLLNIRSMDALDEMKHVRREGDSIEGEGVHKDDRVIALALAVRAWEDSERTDLIASGRTREMEAKRKTLSTADLGALFRQNMMEDFFHKQHVERVQAERAAKRGRRWNW